MDSKWLQLGLRRVVGRRSGHLGPSLAFLPEGPWLVLCLLAIEIILYGKTSLLTLFPPTGTTSGKDSGKR